MAKSTGSDYWWGKYNECAGIEEPEEEDEETVENTPAQEPAPSLQPQHKAAPPLLKQPARALHQPAPSQSAPSQQPTPLLAAKPHTQAQPCANMRVNWACHWLKCKARAATGASLPKTCKTLPKQ